MGSLKMQSVEQSADRERVFLDHYGWLLRRALGISRGARPEAEDLVHDCYVRFIQASSDIHLDDEDRLRGYLYRTLQRLAHSNLESGGHDTFRNLQVVEYDSVEFALASVDRSSLLFIRSDLARICEYCCLRRSTSRAGSVLIFRFFLSYYPSEIVQLLKISNAAVYKLTETGRLEAKVFLTRPESLHFLGGNGRSSTPLSRCHLPDSPSALFAELSRRIFAEPEGVCFAPGRLEKLYASDSEEQLTIQDVAHLASCSACLEGANHLLRLLGLPPRFSDDFNDSNDGKSPRSSSGSKQEPLNWLRKKAQDVHEHRPKNLELVIDGEVHSAQQITSPRSRFQMKLKYPSLPRFIEVRSEQKLRLLCLEIESYDVTECFQIQAEASLSDGRTLSLEVNLDSSTPIIDVSYYDPILEAMNEDWAHEDELHQLVFLEPQQAAPPTPKPRLIGQLKSILSPWLPSIDFSWALSVIVASGVIALLALGAFWVSQSRHKSPVEPQAAQLLAESQRRANDDIPHGGAAHRTFSLEIRSQDGRVIESGMVDTLRSNSPRRSAARYLNSSGKLVAGQWTNAAGKGTAYATKTGIQHPSSVPVPLTFSSAWSHVPEADNFGELGGDSKNLKARRDTNTFDIRYESPDTTSRRTGLVSADLVLSADSMHAVGETFRLHDGNKTWEYRFLELRYEVLPADKVLDSDFDPNPSTFEGRLAGSHTTLIKGGGSTHLALEALQLLDNLGPNVEQIINLERRPDGTIELNGVLPSSVQKSSVEHIFKTLDNGNKLQLALHASDEPTTAPAPSRPIRIESFAPVDVETQRVPFDSQLRAGLTAEGFSGESLDDRVRAIASNIAQRGAELHREAWSLCQIAATDFTLDELRKMAPQDRMLWLTLLDKHLQSFEQQSALLRSDLNHVQHGLDALLPASSASVSPVGNADQLGRAAVLLNHNTDQLDRLLTAGFTLSSSGFPANINLAGVTQLTSEIESEETTLRETIERLYRSDRADVMQ